MKRRGDGERNGAQEGSACTRRGGGENGGEGEESAGARFGRFWVSRGSLARTERALGGDSSA